MQDCCHQLIRRFSIRQHWSILTIIVLTPFFLAGAIPILPTFDDWTSLVSPSFEPFFSKERFLFFGYHWRPFDSIFGYIVGRNPQLLFPLLNHICVVLGHVCGAILLFQIARKLRLNSFASNIATLFFFLSPGMSATVLAVDGLNQTYANLWALLSTLLYLSLQGRKKYIAWLFFIFIATLCKENALMYALISPILAFSFSIINRSILRKDLIIGIAIMVAYALAILLLPSNIDIHPEYVPSVDKTIKDIFNFLLSTWFAVDFVSLLYPPKRDILSAAFTLLLSLPLLYFVFIKNIKSFCNKQLIGLLICLLLAVAPHILTVFSMMHTYAGLPFAAIIIATVIHQNTMTTNWKRAIILYFIAAIFVDIHLTLLSYQSGLVGKEMAQKAIQKTLSTPNTQHTTPQSVYIVIIEDLHPHFSSFCVPPSEAFGWGRAAQFENNYSWPVELNDTIIERNEQYKQNAMKIAQTALKQRQADCAWIIDDLDIEVIK